MIKENIYNEYFSSTTYILSCIFMIAGCLPGGAIGGFISSRLYNYAYTHLCLHSLTVGICASQCANGIAWFAFYHKFLNYNSVHDLIVPSPWTTLFLPFIIVCIIGTITQLFVFKGQSIDYTFSGIQERIDVQTVRPG